MKTYKILKNQKFSFGQYSIIPLRYQDRMKILKWRNEQQYHLRQNKPLTKKDQNQYFNTVVNKLYEDERPNQLLFSFMKNEICIGYGGLVHINWNDKNAEISFIMKTELEKDYFSSNWTLFLKLIEKVAFEELRFHKVFTFAFDLRPHLYQTLENAGYVREASLKSHYFNGGKFFNVVIHSKFNN